MKPSVLMAPVVGRTGASPYAVNGIDPVALWDFGAGVVPAGFGVQRSDPAMSIQASGQWEATAAHTPRFDHSGALPALWAEPAGQNLLVQSAASLDTGWMASGAVAVPRALGALGVFDGIDVSSTGATWHRLLHRARPTVVAGQSYHLSFWVVLGTSGAARCILRNNAAGTETALRATQNATLSEQSAAGTVSMAQTQLMGADGVMAVHLVYVPNFSGALNLGLGPGSAVPGENVIILGAQLEPAAVGSSYIATQGSVATRAADTVVWAAPEGVWDLVTLRGDGVRQVRTGVAVGPGWQPDPPPFRLAQVGLYPVGTFGA